VLLGGGWGGVFFVFLLCGGVLCGGGGSFFPSLEVVVLAFFLTTISYPFLILPQTNRELLSSDFRVVPGSLNPLKILMIFHSLTPLPLFGVNCPSKAPPPPYVFLILFIPLRPEWESWFLLLFDCSEASLLAHLSPLTPNAWLSSSSPFENTLFAVLPSVFFFPTMYPL